MLDHEDEPRQETKSKIGIGIKVTCLKPLLTTDVLLQFNVDHWLFILDVKLLKTYKITVEVTMCPRIYI